MVAHRQVDINNISIEPLQDSSVLDGFSCGQSAVDRNIAKCCEWHGKYTRRIFCAFLNPNHVACGFYCVGMLASETKYLDEHFARVSDGKNYVPFIYLHYIAVQSEYQNNKIGTLLLVHLLSNSLSVVKNIGVFGVALNALTDRAANLYDRYGFRAHEKSGKYPFMVLPAQSLLDLDAP